MEIGVLTSKVGFMKTYLSWNINLGDKENTGLASN